MGCNYQGGVEGATHPRLDVGASSEKHFDCRRLIEPCGNMKGGFTAIIIIYVRAVLDESRD